MDKREKFKRKKILEYFYSIKKKLFKNKKSNKLIVDNNKIDAFSNNVKKVKIRNAGIDMTRIASMHSIIVHHILVHGRAIKKYNKYRELVLMNIISFWHVSIYALISGYIGYKSNKFSNLLYLLCWVILYNASITYYLNRFRPEFKTGKVNYTYFFPVIFGHY